MEADVIKKPVQNRCKNLPRGRGEEGGKRKKKEKKLEHVRVQREPRGYKILSFVLAIIEDSSRSASWKFSVRGMNEVYSNQRSNCRKFNILDGQSLRRMLTMAFKREKERTFPLLRRWLLTYDRNLLVFEITDFYIKSRPIPRLFRLQGNDVYECKEKKKMKYSGRGNIRSILSNIIYLVFRIQFSSPRSSEKSYIHNVNYNGL